MQTKYKIIANQLEKRIRNSDFESKIPSERELCKKYGVSRNTINQALNILVQKGLIFRKPGSGAYISEVLDFEPNKMTIPAFTDGFTYSNETANKTAKTKIIDFKMVLSNDFLSEKLNVEEKQPLFEVTRIRMIGEKPVCYETNIIPLNLLPSLTPKIMEGSLFQYAESVLKQKIINASIEITAPIAKSNIEKALMIAKENENNVVIRSEGTIYLESGTPLEFIDTYYLPDQFTLRATAN